MRRTAAIHFGILTIGLLLASERDAAARPGQDFVKEAKLFHRIIACGEQSEIPGGFDVEAIDKHCDFLRKKMKVFRRRYVDRAQKFFSRWRPANAPKQVVYPFGGGDLVSALVTYPEATEITTISLEHPGDPRRLIHLRRDKEKLAESLGLFGLLGGRLLTWNDSASENLRKMEKGPVPGQLSMFMLALAVFDYEPVSLRFFRIEPDGRLHYYSKREIAKLDGTYAGKLDYRWVNTDYSVAFKNMELHFRPRGQPNAPVRVHRHIAYNLDNKHFGKSELRTHLEKKGRVSTMTKAASFLLWNSSFREIRNYLFANMELMISDATGPLPKHAWEAGFIQTTFGTFEEAFLEYAQGKNSQAMAELWAAQRKRKLNFRYGYPDANGNVHLMITQPRKKRRGKR